MPQGGDRNSHTAVIAARERERTIVSLYARGANLAQIGQQFGLAESTVRSAFNRALKRFPKVEVKNLRNLEGERIQDMRFRLWNEMAGREKEIPDPDGYRL